MLPAVPHRNQHLILAFLALGIWRLFGVSIQISLVTNKAEHLFMCSLTLVPLCVAPSSLLLIFLLRSLSFFYCFVRVF